MMTIHDLPSELTPAFLLRCLAEAERSREPIHATHGSVTFVVYHWMTTDELVNAWLDAKMPSRQHRLRAVAR
jgi:hypothetical protein